MLNNKRKSINFIIISTKSLDQSSLNTKKQLRLMLSTSKTTSIDMMKQVWSKNFSSMKFKQSNLIFKARIFKELLSKLTRQVNYLMNTIILKIWTQKKISQWCILIIQNPLLLFSNLMLIKKLKYLQISLESCRSLVLLQLETQKLLHRFKGFELMKKLKGRNFDLPNDQ